jgi:protoheme IX farnesyltransferase
MNGGAVKAIETVEVVRIRGGQLAILRGVIKDYFALTKPRVISLLLFTTWAAMFIAARGWPGFWLFVATGAGFYLAAGSAHTLNMVFDRDIDGKVERTAQRPVVAGRITVRNALIFAAAQAIGSFALLWSVANLLSACMALAGLLFYVVVYTVWLKRRTEHNIVIGGAAGSFPPLVGWVAVTGSLNPLAWILFAIIFLWTPVHFWALAIMIKDDYAKLKIPMLPVVRGERMTTLQILFYAVLTTLISLAPVVILQGAANSLSWLYGGAAVALNGVLLWKSLQLHRQPDRPHASALFHYSMLYLALLFLAMAVDSSLLI